MAAQLVAAGIMLRPDAWACLDCAHTHRLKGPPLWHGGSVRRVCVICDTHVAGPMTLEDIDTARWLDEGAER